MARRTFGGTWWGKAWLDALDKRALKDPNRLPRGRTYARQERVTDLELSPGLVQAKVWGTDRYLTQLSVRVLTSAEWDHVLDTIMAKAANSAALLAGEVPQAIGDLVLPDRGDLGPDCSCPDWAELCKHAAAVCYTIADLIDEDPFALLTLRGRGREEVLAEVRNRRSAALGVAAVQATQLPRGVDPGVSAAASYRREISPADRSVPVPRSPAVRYRLDVSAPADAGIVPQDLAALIADAADRAWRMLAQGQKSGLDASVGDDVVRRAARSPDIAEIAVTTGLDPAELHTAAAAWKVGGRDGYRVSRDRWEPPPGALAAGSEALGSGAKIRGNRVSIGPRQFRLDPDGAWWRFDADDHKGWVLTAGPATDPGDLLDVGPDARLMRSD